MKAKQKHTSPKESWRSIRARYTWHLHPPFEKTFDYSHWWDGHTQLKPEEALYELARRHPLVAGVRLKLLSQPKHDLHEEPAAIHCLCEIGLKPWPKLTPEEQDFWEDTAGKMKGLDCRHDLERCNSITLLAFTGVIIKRMSLLKRKLKGLAIDQTNKLVGEDLAKKPPSVKELESAVVREALAAHRQGSLLISVVPDLAAEDAEALFSKMYRKHRMLAPPAQRNRWWKQWLPLISEFENEEISRPSTHKVDPQIFAHYRRAVDGISFETSSLGGHPTRCRHILQAHDYLLGRFLSTFSKG